MGSTHSDFFQGQMVKGLIYGPNQYMVTGLSKKEEEKLEF
jgi:hypothetical protein